MKKAALALGLSAALLAGLQTHISKVMLLLERVVFLWIHTPPQIAMSLNLK